MTLYIDNFKLRSVKSTFWQTMLHLKSEVQENTYTNTSYKMAPFEKL